MSSDFDEMACLRVEDGYHGIGKVVSLAVCGMERKVNVSSKDCTCISCAEWAVL